MINSAYGKGTTSGQADNVNVCNVARFKILLPKFQVVEDEKGVHAQLTRAVMQGYLVFGRPDIRESSAILTFFFLIIYVVIRVIRVLE